jgi:hypothetical protein
MIVIKSNTHYCEEDSMKNSKSLTVSVKTIVLFAIIVTLFQTHIELRFAQAQERTSGTTVINLPQPAIDGLVSIEKALLERRSVRSYKDR